jgi:hypothetical protein
LHAPFVVTKTDNLQRVFFQQLTPWGVAQFVIVERRGDVVVSGHMWPALPSPAPMSDESLGAKLRALDPAPDLDVLHRYATTARADEGPLEVREAACLHDPVEAQLPPAARTNIKHPCIDARTGEELTPAMAGWSVSTENGRVTSRRMTRGGASP